MHDTYESLPPLNRELVACMQALSGRVVSHFCASMLCPEGCISYLMVQQAFMPVFESSILLFSHQSGVQV